MSTGDTHGIEDGSAPLRIAFHPHRELPWLLVPEGVPLQVLIDASPVRVPNTRAWFRGMVSQRGNLLPVFDLAGWAGLPADADTRPQIVAIGTGTLACAVLCDTAPTLIRPGDEIDAADDIGALSSFLGRRYACAQGSAREFDFRRWLTATAQRISGDASG